VLWFNIEQMPIALSLALLLVALTNVVSKKTQVRKSARRPLQGLVGALGADVGYGWRI